MFSWLKSKCSHAFEVSEIKLTGFKLPDSPKNNDYLPWIKYYRELYKSPGIKQRVAADCNKCGKTFYAHCGLDLPGKLITKALLCREK